jgi:hypothetical protein
VLRDEQLHAAVVRLALDLPGVLVAWLAGGGALPDCTT